MRIQRFEFNLFGENTYIVWNETTREAAVIDPGMANERERATFDNFLAENSLRLVHLINTHMHLDHAFGNEYVKTRYGLDTEANSAEQPLAANLEAQARMFHIRTSAPINPVMITRQLKEGDKVFLGDEFLSVLDVPGHSPGSIALYCAASHFVITGDVLFAGSIGRTDLTGGDYGTLITSIQQKLMCLPPDTVVYPGHGPSTTIGQERQSNPYI